MSKPATTAPVSFKDLELIAPLLKALEEVGYETPSPIQAQAIPPLLQGLDLLGHAPTGTGKTAAFALPLLSRLDIANPNVQIMTLTPTRELAIQVAEAFQRYASHIKGFHVLPIYGGAEYGSQLRALERGVHVVVGTPGRVMDHMRKGRLKLDGLQALVLDEADEMLRMGFIDEVEWILEQAPAKRQMALFSATMPRQIERIARKHLDKPQEISIKAKTATAETIRQRYWLVSGVHKLDAFTRILEVEDFDAILVFVRTKLATTQLAEKLEARGYAAAAMNGDMAQKDREKMVDRLKRRSLDILVATDVAARGLDVSRISHVINYDIPNDTEAYIHRIGRTGRAGRSGEAILFVAPRERRMLRAIENATRQKITELQMPTMETVNNKRIADFKQKISDTIAAGELAFMQGIVEQYEHENDVSPLEIAAALAQLSIGDAPFLMTPTKDRPPREDRGPTRREQQSRKDRDDARGERGGRGAGREKFSKGKARDGRPPDSDMQRYRIEVGYDHGVKPGNIVGAIANEAGLEGKRVGQVEISERYSTVDLPKGMPKPVFRDLRKVWVCGQQLRISRLDGGSDDEDAGVKAKRPEKRSAKPADKLFEKDGDNSGTWQDSYVQSERGAGGKPKQKFKGKAGGKPGGKSKSAGKAKPAGKGARGASSDSTGRSKSKFAATDDDMPATRPLTQGKKARPTDADTKARGKQTTAKKTPGKKTAGKKAPGKKKKRKNTKGKANSSNPRQPTRTAKTRFKKR